MVGCRPAPHSLPSFWSASQSVARPDLPGASQMARLHRGSVLTYLDVPLQWVAYQQVLNPGAPILFVVNDR